jgi:pyruvate/2-oxoglutarate dehydrogenase complex dihydrolipoamide dehydrogenase (E3) component
MTNEVFDAIVIGSGQGGNPLAKAMAEAGWKTAVIERKDVGGTCVNVGCTPTKTLVASARVAYLARRAREFGVVAEKDGDILVTVDMSTIIERKRKVVAASRTSSEKGLEETANLTLIRGEASFSGAHDVSVTFPNGSVRELVAKKIFINTGTHAAIPAIAGLREVPFLNNESIMELETLPEHLIVLGGGYIALEFAQMFRRFGSAVTMVQKATALAESEDADVSEEITSILREDGIEVLLQSETVRVRSEGRSIVLTVKVGGAERVIGGTHLLVAVGRVPNTEALHCERAGVELDAHGFVKANPRLETTTDGIWAIGDVKGGPAFTHISYDDYRVLRTNLLEGGSRETTGRPVPYTIFIDPELGRIGMTEDEARKAGKKIKVAKMPMSSVARAFESAETRGFLKAIVDTDTDQILGAAVLGVDGGEIAAQIQIAMMGKLTASTLREGIWSHPTRAEALNRLFSSYQ